MKPNSAKSAEKWKKNPQDRSEQIHNDNDNTPKWRIRLWNSSFIQPMISAKQICTKSCQSIWDSSLPESKVLGISFIAHLPLLWPISAYVLGLLQQNSEGHQRWVSVTNSISSCQSRSYDYLPGSTVTEGTHGPSCVDGLWVIHLSTLVGNTGGCSSDSPPGTWQMPLSTSRRKWSLNTLCIPPWNLWVTINISWEWSLAMPVF